MDLSLLETKAATPVGSLADEALAENTETRWIISNQFNCSSVTIKEILIGADIRTEHGKRNEYPSIELWFLQWYETWVGWNQKQIYYYRKIQSIPIELSPHNFTTNGLYHYVLPTPISFSSNNHNYRLGVYQPQDDKSVVRLYNGSVSNPITVGKIRLDSINETDIRITDPDREIDLINATEAFMVHLITGILACPHNDNCYTDNFIFVDPSSCFDQAFSGNDINTNSLSITSVIPVTDTRVFPDIHFTCTGIITNWLIGITEEQDTTKLYPNIYIERSSQLIHALTVDTSATIPSNGNVYNFTSEVIVQSGDILVINVINNSNPMYYQQYNGPLNYKLNNDELIPLENNDYPLVSVIISKSYIS